MNIRVTSGMLDSRKSDVIRAETPYFYSFMSLAAVFLFVQ